MTCIVNWWMCRNLAKKFQNCNVTSVIYICSNLEESLEKTKRKYQSRLKRMEQQILQHLLHNQLSDPRDSQIDNDSIDKIEAEVEAAVPDLARSSDLVTSWIPTTGSVLSLISSESDAVSD